LFSLQAERLKQSVVESVSSSPPPAALAVFLPLIRELHAEIRSSILRAYAQTEADELCQIAAEEEGGDTIYAVDRISEELVLSFFQRIAVNAPLILIAEGLPGGRITLPEGTPEKEVLWRVIVDPIDGTRCLMYQKRSAWVLTAVAPNRGAGTGLQDIELAVQTEIPLLKQYLCDALWAFRGKGVQAERLNLLEGTTQSLQLQPSRSQTIAHGYAMVTRFFPGARQVLAEIDEEVVFAALGPVLPGKAHCFEDQYTTTGGQLYELMAGHDRFNADLRPLMERILQTQGLRLGICCHPYDICTELIARELGVIVTDERGERLNAPLAVEPDIAWAGYANEDIRKEIEPRLQQALRRRNLYTT
jgi:fructose-1,6-bisphosphatase/inositol monophosphatase family enzyme